MESFLMFFLLLLIGGLFAFNNVFRNRVIGEICSLWDVEDLFHHLSGTHAIMVEISPIAIEINQSQ